MRKVGGYDVGETLLATMEGSAGFLRQINELATKEYQTGEVAYIRAIAPDLTGGLAFMPNPEAFSYYSRTSRTDAPNWENRVAAKSLQSYFTYSAVAHAALVAPTPMLIVHGTTDLFLWPEHAQRVYDAASGDNRSPGSRPTTTSSSTTKTPTSAGLQRTSSNGSTRDCEREGNEGC